MKNLGTTIELDPKGDKITCPAFGLYSSPAEYSTMGHIFPRPSRVSNLVTRRDMLAFAMSERRPAYPAHAPDMREDEDEDEDDKPLVRPASRKEPC